MYNELLALLKAKAANGEEMQETAEGAIRAIREYVQNFESGIENADEELVRLAGLLTDG